MDLPTTQEERDAEQTKDINGAWVDTWHYVKKLDANHSVHLVVINRTVIREYTSVWKNGVPSIEDAPPEICQVGDVTSSAELKEQGYKRKRGLQYNLITREYRAQL